MSKILIIGAQGMLGQELANIFSKDKNYQVFNWDKKEIDITKEDEVREKIINLQPEIIINAAAYNNVDACEDNWELAKNVNGLAPGYLAKISQKIKAIFVHYSTGYVFDGNNPKGYSENDIPCPISKYAESKLLGEEEVKKNCTEYYLVRLNLLFGRAGVGPEAKKSFVDLMLNLAKETLRHSREGGNPGGQINLVNNEISNPTYAPHLVQKIKELIEKKYLFGIYHLTNSGSCSWYEWAKEIFKLKNINIQLNPVSSDSFARKAKRPKYSILLNTKTEPLPTWQEALKEYLLLP